MDISSSIDRAVSTYFSNWLGQHPYLAWSIAHPLPSLGLLLLLILSLVDLFGAIDRGVEQIWLFPQNTIQTVTADF
jgi:hydrogenase/urease accessory protein HupE